MASSYSSNLRLELMVNGENDATWGTKTNTTLQLLEAAIAGRSAVTHDDTANYTLTTANGSADEARRMILNIAGALSAARNVVVPTQSKFYVVKNATTGGYAVTVKTSAGSGIAVPNGKTMLLFCDGTNVVEAIDQVVGTLALTSPDITTSITTTSTSFTALAGATTLLTLGGTGASASTFFPSTLDTTSSTTGAIRTSGGISAAKALNIGTTATIGGALTYGGVTLNNAVTGTGNMVLSASPTLTGTVVLTGTTITGTPTWSSSQAITLSTAAQPNITSTGALTGGSIGVGFGTINIGSNALTAGAGSFTTGTFSGKVIVNGAPAGNTMPFLVSSGFAKTDTSVREVALFGSNEGTASAGLKTLFTGGASTAVSTFALQTGDNATNAGTLALQPYGGSVSVGGGTGGLTAGAISGTTYTASSYIQGTEETEPAAPSANGYRIFAVDSGGGKTILKVRFASGASQTIATEP